MVKLLAFSAFEDTASAVAAAADMMEGKMGKVSALRLCYCVHSSVEFDATIQHFCS
jgi:NOP5NT (NUC127) domain